MQRFCHIDALRAALQRMQRDGEVLALVPTMGGLHAGHLALVQQAKALQARVVVSIFVNPVQFAPGEDFASYPRTCEADCAALQEAGTDVVFTPSQEDMYPCQSAGHTEVVIADLETIYCGRFRPGHFRGVAMVLSKLFHIVSPQHAVFGEKDYQQLVLIRRMVRDLHFPISVHGVPTVRETDGLAMSSRNRYLSAHERSKAPMLYTTLCDVATAWDQGETDREHLQAAALSGLRKAGFAPQYLAIAHGDTLAEPVPGEPRVVLAAARLGRTRLIDNIPPRDL